MEFSWHSKGKKHCRETVDDWLCICLEPHERTGVLELLEGDHHYFTEFYLFDDKKNRLHAAPLLRSGKFSFSFDAEDVHLLVAKFRFLSYEKPPGKNGAPFVVPCAELQIRNRKQAFSIAITQDPADRVHPPVATGLESVLDKFTSSSIGRNLDILTLAIDEQGRPALQIQEAASFNLPVILLGDDKVESFWKPGVQVPAETLKRYRHCVIPAGKAAPKERPDLSGICLAVPFLPNAQNFVLGRPVILSPLISDLRLRPRIPEMLAMWIVNSPRAWTTVFIEWYLYDDSSRAVSQVQKLEVPCASYNSRVEVMLFPSCRDYRGYHVHLKATARIFSDSSTQSS